MGIVERRETLQAIERRHRQIETGAQSTQGTAYLAPGTHVRIVGKYFTGQRRIVIRALGPLRDDDGKREMYYLCGSTLAPSSGPIGFPVSELERLPVPSIFNIGPSREAPPHG